MNDKADYEKARAERKEVGFEPVEPPPGADLEQDVSRCRRCKRPTEYEAIWCLSCESMYGDE